MTILKRVAIFSVGLLSILTIYMETTIRSEMEGSLAAGIVMAAAYVFWCQAGKESDFSSQTRKLRY